MSSDDATIGPSRVPIIEQAKEGRWRGVLAQFAPLLVGAALLILGALVVDGTGLNGLTATPVPPSGAVRADQPAPDFRLRDQSGAQVSLESLRGKAVVLTFLYSTCPDLCPVTLGKFGLVRDELGVQAGDVAFLVITVDPERDNPAQLRQFLAAQGLEQRVAFLTGDRATLERVWGEYGITVARGAGLSGSAGEGYEVIHTERIYLIDRGGCLRGLLRSTAEPQELYVALAGLLAAGTSYEGGACG